MSALASLDTIDRLDRIMGRLQALNNLLLSTTDDTQYADVSALLLPITRDFEEFAKWFNDTAAADREGGAQ